MKKLFIIFLVAVLAGLITVGPAWGEKIEYRAVVDTSGVQKVEILGGSYFFKPNYIIVKVNVPVELTIRKEAGATPHDFTLKAPEAGIDISETLGTEPKVIKFTPTKAGEYPFYCGKRFLFFKSHRNRGMEGALEVIE